jgi:chromate transporter
LERGRNRDGTSGPASTWRRHEVRHAEKGPPRHARRRHDHETVKGTAALFAGPGLFGAIFANDKLPQIFWYFAKAGMFVFGSGLAVVPFLYGGVVQGNHWLTDHQFVDAVAVAMITPGPVVITVAFIGYLVAGVAGATAAALGIFLPVYIVVILLAPSYKRLRTSS